MKVSPLAACILIALFATPVIAHEGVEHPTEAEAEAHVTAAANPNPLMKPLDVIKARAQQIQQGAQNAKIELRADTKVQLQGASSSGERKDVLKNAAGVRVDIAKDHIGATAQLKQNVRDAVRMHGGLIKERFVLAIRQMNNLLTRIDSRIAKMQAAGIDTSTVVSVEADARVAITTAQVDAQAVADFVASVNDASDREAVRAELQAKIKTAQASIKASHAAVMKVVRALVSLAKNNNVKVDTSVSATTTVQ